jgi:hypothetical protein
MSRTAGFTTIGRSAAAAWLRDRGLEHPTGRWHVEIALDVRPGPAPSHYDLARDSRFHVDIYSEEWGFMFCHAARASWIRVTDIAFVHGRDDYGLLVTIPALAEIGSLLSSVEATHALRFDRDHARIRTNLDVTPAVRRWLDML